MLDCPTAEVSQNRMDALVTTELLESMFTSSNNNNTVQQTVSDVILVGVRGVGNATLTDVGKMSRSLSTSGPHSKKNTPRN